jgi:hypothetical protein
VDVVRDFIAAQTALLTKVSSVPVEPFGYGVDLVCADDLTASMTETDMSSAQSIAQDAYHRLSTRKGSLLDDPDFGFDLVSLLSAPLTQEQITALPLQIQNELAKDDRVDDVTVELSYSYATKTLTVTCLFVLANPEQTQFTAIMSVTSLEALLEVVL